MTLPVRVFAAAAVALAAVSAACAGTARSQPPARSVTCSNPVSGTSWQIAIDLANTTVDAVPAQISDSEIAWRDPTGRNYTLDRRSGELTMIAPSSTGGWVQRLHCRLPP